MKLRTALYDGHTELATIDDLGAVTLGTPVFPTGNAGEVVFVDGSNHAATSADLRFDETSKILRVGGDAQTTGVDVGEYGVFRWSYENGDPAMQLVQESELDGFSGEAVGVRDGIGGPAGFLLMSDFTSASNWVGAAFGNYPGFGMGIVGVADGTTQTNGPNLAVNTFSADTTRTGFTAYGTGGGVEIVANDKVIAFDGAELFPAAAGISLGINGFAWASVNASEYKSDGTAGISGSFTTGSLVGKTVTYTNGLVTGFA
jgi:hypothetical protein